MTQGARVLPEAASLSLATLAGQVIVGGFASPTLSGTFEAALSRGERGGAILFRRNLTGSLLDALRLTRSIEGATPGGLPPLIAVDQEGGRVTRFGAPVLRLPPMRSFGRVNDADLVRRAARVLGIELAALGFTMDFAPVLDVDSCATNPIIGDRSFHQDPAIVARLGAAYAEGLQEAGVMACGKHFPGHGDTTVDSHLDLPRVEQPLGRLHDVELVPFRGLRSATCAAVMTAHVMYPALDDTAPATMSRRIVHDLLRTEMGYDGLIVSDDLEMKAVFDRYPIEESAVMAVRAGCDILLVCASEELQTRAHEALVQAAEKDSAFRDQLVRSVARGLDARRKHTPRPVSDDALGGVVGGAASIAMAEELTRRGVFA